MSDRDLPASADLVRQARSNLLNEVVWPSLAVQRLVFIRGTSGIGDSLNGLVSAYWLSHILGAELSLCWPEATHMPWRVRLESAGCVAPKARYERLARLLVRHAPPGTKTQTASSLTGRVLVEDNYSVARFNCGTRDLPLWSRRKWARLRARPTLYLVANQGLTSWLWLHSKAAEFTDVARLLREHGSSPWDAAGAALRRMLALPRPDSGSDGGGYSLRRTY